MHKETIGADLFNQRLTGEVAKTMNAIRCDSDHAPVVIIHTEGSICQTTQSVLKETATEKAITETDT